MTAYHVLYHWWPDCPEWPTHDDPHDTSGVVHAVAHTPEAVTCGYCRKDNAIDRADETEPPW